jgi:hypothetical protein
MSTVTARGARAAAHGSDRQFLFGKSRESGCDYEKKEI